MKLIIVESPSKAKTINKYLGKGYTVMSSIGHIRDLPKSSKDAVDIDKGFKPHYVISEGKQSVINRLVAEAKKSKEIILAPDPDREGEAIAWHLAEIFRDELGKDVNKKLSRVTFNSITKDTVLEALENPRKIDQNLRHAQEARRVLDRLMGYELSGLIWKKVRYGLSAGRVQSPALRIIMERERQIRAFVPDDYFLIHGDFTKDGGKRDFRLSTDDDIDTKKEAEAIEKIAKKGAWYVASIKKSDGQRKARAPFTTSTLQQTASTRLGMSPSRTMRAAQKLYEGGHITYMRTDSTSLNPKAQKEIIKHIEKTYGKEFIEAKKFATKSKNAQEAHEAVRPTHIEKTSAGLTADQKAVYSLIHARTVASQMTAARLERTKIIASVKDAPKDFPIFSTNGHRIIFDGWLAADPHAKGDDVMVPKLDEGDHLNLENIEVEEKWTSPPNRYSEAGLIKELEKRGIGRPSTYAATIRTLQNRGYVVREGRTLIPTDTGDVVSTFLEKHFMDYIDDDFTAEMEDDLDNIADGTAKYEPVLSKFYKPFHKHVASKENIEKLTNLGKADKKFKCPECKKSMVIKLGRNGKFLSCSTFPECDGALTLDGRGLGDHAPPLGVDPKSKEKVYVMDGRFGPYVQLGASPDIPEVTKFEKGHKKTDEEKEQVKKEKEARKAAQALPKPRRASIPKNIEPEKITLKEALHLLELPRELGAFPDSDEIVIANIGRFGPYVGHGKEFRSIKKSSGLDPYTITLKEAVKLLKTPKSLPKGTTLVNQLGKHPKTGKEIRVLGSKSGNFLQKGLKRIYLPDDMDPKKLTIEEAVALLATG